MTQASVLKVTANGTTTSPVLRGAWIMERILGKPPPPPPPSVPAVEPDIRGATTIREQLDKHRDLADVRRLPREDRPGRLRAGELRRDGRLARPLPRAWPTAPPAEGSARTARSSRSTTALPVDASGELPDGRKFSDVRELKRLLLDDERADRPQPRAAAGRLRHRGRRSGSATGREVEADPRREPRPSGYGVRTLIHEIVQSELFLEQVNRSRALRTS